jgi:hypothetical protein
MHETDPAHMILLNLETPVICGEEYIQIQQTDIWSVQEETAMRNCSLRGGVSQCETQIPVYNISHAEMNLFL